MNSSSEPANAVQPRSPMRASWLRRTWRGDATTGEPSCQSRSHCTITVASSQGMRRSVARSGMNTNRRSRPPTRRSRNPARCSSRHRPRAGSCTPRRRARRCPRRTRAHGRSLPINRPCMSQNPTMTVSMSDVRHGGAELVERQRSVGRHAALASALVEEAARDGARSSALTSTSGGVSRKTLSAMRCIEPSRP